MLYLSLIHIFIGGCAIDATGAALPDETLDVAKASDAVLLAAVGGPKWDTTDPAKPRPEQGLLGIRKALGLYTNLRPVQIFSALAGASTLKPEIVDGVDLMIVRELTGGLYFGRRERFYDEEGCGTDGAAGQRAYDTLDDVYKRPRPSSRRRHGQLRSRQAAPHPRHRPALGVDGDRPERHPAQRDGGQAAHRACVPPDGRRQGRRLRARRGALRQDLSLIHI